MQHYIIKNANSTDGLTADIKNKDLSSNDQNSSSRSFFILISILLAILTSSVLFWLLGAEIFDKQSQNNETVTIPEFGDEILSGTIVYLPESANFIFDKLTIRGTLKCRANSNVKIRARQILIEEGLFQCTGFTDDSPFKGSLQITLYGDSPFIQVKNGGKLLLLGDDTKQSWTRLVKNNLKGDTIIHVPDSVKWQVGDEIVVAPTDFDFETYETRTIKQVQGSSVSDDAVALVLNEPLKFNHYGTEQTFAGKTLNSQAEVALLTRNIKIYGDVDSYFQNLTGVSVSVFANASANIDNIEIRYGGQFNEMGTYPLHFHNIGDASNSHATRSSVYLSWNRCISIHCTDNLLVSEISCIDHVGHGFFMEEGPEQGNVLRNNLGITTRVGSGVLNPSDNFPTGSEAVGPATFWTSNPNNEFTGNVAAGSQWFGFSIEQSDEISKFQKENAVCPNRAIRQIDLRKIPIKKFEGNIAHSTLSSAFWIGTAVFPSKTSVLSSLQAYKVSPRGNFGACFWIHGFNFIIKDSICADFGRALWFVYETTLANSVLVAATDNKGDPQTQAEKKAQRSLPKSFDRVYGHNLYDGPTVLSNVDFVNFDFGSNSGVTSCHFNIFGGAESTPKNVVTGARFTNPSTPLFCQSAGRTMLWDRDGSISGTKNTHFMNKFQSGRRDLTNPGILFNDISCRDWPPSSNGQIIACSNLPESCEIRIEPRPSPVFDNATLRISELNRENQQTVLRETSIAYSTLFKYFPLFIKANTIYRVVYNSHIAPIPSGQCFNLMFRSATFNDTYFLTFTNGKRFDTSKSADKNFQSLNELYGSARSGYFINSNSDIVLFAIRMTGRMPSVDGNEQSMNWGSASRIICFT